MSSETLLDLIRQKFSPQEGQMLVQSLSQDPQVWHLITDENKSLAYFQNIPADISSYTPGAISLWLIEHELDVQLGNIKDYEYKLPPKIRQKAALTFETVLNTSLPPVDLISSGLLALTLRERRVLKGTWAGVANEIFQKRDQNSFQKNFAIWRTPIACLYHFCNDFDQFMNEFIFSKKPNISKSSIPVFIHTYLSNPQENRILEGKLFDLAQNLHIDLQLDCLHWLDVFGKQPLRETLAKHLIQTKSNVDFFANVFSGMETFSTINGEIDPINKTVRYSLPENVNRLGAFYYYSGDNQKSSETYQMAGSILEFLRTQALFQSATNSKRDIISQSQWLQIIKAVPNSVQARLFYIQALINNGRYEEAQNYLREIPPSKEKRFISAQLQSSNQKGTLEAIDPNEIITDHSLENPPFQASYYVHHANMNTEADFLRLLLSQNVSNQDPNWIEKLIKNSFQQLDLLELACEYLEKSQNINKAVEISSFLERAKPEDKKQKQTLARLLCKAERWGDAFSILQNLVTSDSVSEIIDLERFAEAALKTNHVDMAISICQNILKRDSVNVKALILLGEGYMENGDSVKAIQHMEQVVEMIPDEGDTWLALSKIWQRNGQIDRSFEILDKGVHALPNNPKLLRALGSAHLGKQAPADAVIYLGKAYEIEPEHFKGRLNFAQAKYQLGQYEQAWELLKTDVNNYQDRPVVAPLLGKVLLAMGELKTAENVLIFAAEQDPSDLETVSTAAGLTIKQQEISLKEIDEVKLDQVLNIINRSLHSNPDNIQLLIDLADINRLKGHFQEALDAYSQLSERDFSDDSSQKWRLAFGLGKSAIKLENPDLALAALQEASSKKSGNLMVLHALAEAYQINELHEKAQVTAKTCLKIAPQDIDNIIWFADFKIKNNEPQEAVTALKEAIEIKPDSIELKLWLARTLLTINKKNDAFLITKEIIDGSKADAEDLNQAAYICVRLNKADMAIQALEKSLQLASSYSPTRIMDLAAAYSQNGLKDKALEIIDNEKASFAEHPQLALLKSDILENLGQYGTALETLALFSDEKKIPLLQNEDEIKLLKQSPLLYIYDFSTPSYYYRVGKLNRALGNISTAQTSFQKALEIRPDHEILQNALAESYFIGLYFPNVLEKTTSDIVNEPLAIDVEGINLFFTHIESLISTDEFDHARQLMLDDLPEWVPDSPRKAAIQSRLAKHEGNLDEAAYYLNLAHKLYRDQFNASEFALEMVFKQSIALNSIAEAYFDLERYKEALTYHQELDSMLSNQPLYDLGFAKALIKCAELQQVANILKITQHCPGNRALSDQNKYTCQELINNVKGFLPQDQYLCLKSRMIGAFTGQWPISLSSETCITTADSASALILGSANQDLIQQILDTFPEAAAVLQAYGVYALRNGVTDALPYITRAIKIIPSDPINHALYAFLSESDPENAIKSLEIALGLWENETEWHMLAAEMYKKLGNTSGASRHISEALSYNPDNPKYWEKRGEINIKLNQLPEAKSDFEKSIAL